MRPRPALAPLVVAGALLLTLPRAGLACSVCLAGDPLFSTHGASAQEEGSLSFYWELRRISKTSGIPVGEGALTEVGEAAPSAERSGNDAARRSRSARARRPARRPRHAAHGHGPPGRAEPAEVGALATSPAKDGEESLRSYQVDVYASWTPHDRLTLTVDLPFAWNRITRETGGAPTSSTLSGLGDLSLASSYVLWRDRDVLPSTWVEGRLWLKAPTGRDDAEVDGGRDPHLQPGTGSWDLGAGLAAAHRRSWGSLYASVFYRENTEGALDYTYGDVVLANLAVEVPVGHALGRGEWSWLTGGLELNFRYAGYDEHHGSRVRDSGGSILYATPSVRILLPWRVRESPVSLRAAVQIPLTQHWLHNTQDEHEVWSLGMLIAF